MDNELLRSLAETCGTPFYVFDEDCVQSRMHDCLGIVGPSVRLCYSIKANPFLIPAMTGVVGTLEVCSPGELEICHALGVAPEAVLFSGVNKTAGDIERALDLGVRHFTCESPLHIRLLNEAALQRGLALPVLLRLTAGSQFGMDESDLRYAIQHRDETPGLSIRGIHYFSGTQQKRLNGQRKELAMLRALIDSLEADYGFKTQEIEYGAGLYFPYFEGEDDSDTLSPLRELAPDLQELAEHCRLTVEMGRFFASPCGTYVTRVCDTKVCKGTNIAILDGGMHHVNYYGGSMGMRVPHIDHLPVQPVPEDAADESWMLCGSLCTTADVLVRSIALRSLNPGDLLAFHNCGAYSVTEAPVLFLSRDLPKVILLRGGTALPVRDTLPAWQFNCPQQTKC
ncbi:MAG: alanine racemase [Clostridia bacterium]|nr:alanine racemase [Clostridia bacterium]